jgi:hypothetical protein
VVIAPYNNNIKDVPGDAACKYPFPFFQKQPQKEYLETIEEAKGHCLVLPIQAQLRSICSLVDNLELRRVESATNFGRWIDYMFVKPK